MAMSAKHLHFEKAFLPRAEKGTGENPLPEILYANVTAKELARDHSTVTGMRLLPLRITKRRKRI